MELVVNKEQAETVKHIFALFLEGESFSGIAKILNREQAPNPTGCKWSIGHISSMLRNEKYKGDALLQKSYTVDFLTKKQVVNRGEVPQYYVTGSHEAIIDPAVFDFVQQEIATRKQANRSYSRHLLFSGKIQCGDCGGWYGSKTWHSNDERYRKTIWRCNHKYGHGENCTTPKLEEPEIKNLYLQAVTDLLGESDEASRLVREEVMAELDTTRLQEQADKLIADVKSASAAIDKLIDRNARTASNQAEYNRQFNALTARHGELSVKYEKVAAQIVDRENRIRSFKHFEASGMTP